MLQLGQALSAHAKLLMWHDNNGPRRVQQKIVTIPERIGNPSRCAEFI
jgi:hypothetical protein